MFFACSAALTTTTPVPTKTHTGASATTLRYTFFRSIEAAGKDWDAAAPAHNLFLQRTYLHSLESNPPIGMRFGYLIFYRGNHPIGVAVVQIKYFKGDDNINDLTTENAGPCFFTNLGNWFKRRVAGWAAADILICGNMLLTGEHGYWFDNQKISDTEAATLLEQALAETVQRLEREGMKIPVILIKDLPESHRPHYGSFFEKEGFVEFDIQPCMVLPLGEHRDFDAYLAAMSTKYRTRAKRAFKKATELEKRELQLPEIQRELPRLYELYRHIARNAGFNMVDLNEQYLPGLKRDLSGHFRLFAYYLNGEMVAFFTTICNHGEVEAHFLGYEPEHNHEYQLYLNILYDIVRLSFEAGCERLVLARTALEIKSSVGAVPEHYWCYLRHQNPVLNHFTAPVLDYLKPVEEWQQRHPFKD